MHGCSAAIYSCFKAILPQCRKPYTRAYIIYILYKSYYGNFSDKSFCG